MKLLLTSTGVTNKSIHKALEELLGKPTNQASIAFIPTSAYGVDGDKSWLMDELQTACDLVWKNFDIVEIAALTKTQIEERLKKADVIHMNGGNAYFLMGKIIESGLEELLPELLQAKVYVGSSAGSVITSKLFPGNLHKIFGEEKKVGVGTVDHGLGLVDFVFKSHLNSKDFPERTIEWCDKIALQIKAPFYVLDDNTALKIIDEKVNVISEGQWKKYS